jgi:FolB domain-containing protein
MDRITLRGVRASGRHGANPGERDREQPFEIDAVIELDLHAAQASDDLADTLDYANLHDRLVHVVASTSFVLLERLAGELLATIFTDARAVRAEVTIAKPRLLEGATPAVTLSRENPNHRSIS